MTTTNPIQSGFFTWNIKIRIWKILAALVILPFLTLWFMVVHQKDEIIALTRSDVVMDASGNRVWYGTFSNTDDIPYRDLAVTVRFLDGDNQSVGEVEAEADELQAGEGLELHASLAPEAEKLLIYSMRWRNDRTTAFFGPFRQPWEFGYLMHDPGANENGESL